jgi:diguanylate cyclase (GGDEF)-like protein
MTLTALLIVGTVVAAAVFSVWSGRLALALSRATRNTDALERELSLLRRAHVLLEQDQTRLTHFLREFPLLTRDLHGEGQQRRIPGVLANVAMRSLHPGQAVVLLRRRPTEDEPERASRLVVAAVAPEGCPVKVGFEVAIGEGEIGLAAEEQQVMSRQDLELEAGSARLKLQQQGLPGFEADLVAPMIFEGETLGVIALSGCSRTSDDAKAALRLIAQTGAQAVHNAAAYNQMKTTADLDGLTGILNKRQMTRTLAERLHEAEKSMRPLSVFLFDVDNFKNYNDLNGHVAGDRLLQMLARLVGENTRKTDVFGRFGGEEFLLVLPNTPLPHALTVAEKVRAAIASHALPFAERQPLGCISVSGGVAQYPIDALDSARLLHAADWRAVRGQTAGPQPGSAGDLRIPERRESEWMSAHAAVARPDTQAGTD